MMAFAQDRAKQDVLKDLVDAGPEGVGQELTDGDQGKSDSYAEGKSFEELVTTYMAKHNCKKGIAVSAVAREYPKKHDEYVEGLKKN